MAFIASNTAAPKNRAMNWLWLYSLGLKNYRNQYNGTRNINIGFNLIYHSDDYANKIDIFPKYSTQN